MMSTWPAGSAVARTHRSSGCSVNSWARRVMPSLKPCTAYTLATSPGPPGVLMRSTSPGRSGRRQSAAGRRRQRGRNIRLVRSPGRPSHDAVLADCGLVGLPAQEAGDRLLGDAIPGGEDAVGGTRRGGFLADGESLHVCQYCETMPLAEG